MKTLIGFLQGKKAKFIALVAALYAVLDVFAVIAFTPEQEKALAILGLALLAFAFRDAIKKQNFYREGRNTLSIKNFNKIIINKWQM